LFLFHHNPPHPHSSIFQLSIFLYCFVLSCFTQSLSFKLLSIFLYCFSSKSLLLLQFLPLLLSIFLYCFLTVISRFLMLFPPLTFNFSLLFHFIYKGWVWNPPMRKLSIFLYCFPTISRFER